MKIKNEAMQYLEKDILLNISIIEPIRRNTCDVLYADYNGVLIYEKTVHAYMLSTDDSVLADKLTDNLKKTELFTVHQKQNVELIKNKFDFSSFFDAKQAVYLGKKALYIDPRIDIRLLCDKDKSFIKKNYSVVGSAESYTSDLIDKKHMWAAFDGNNIMGFIGIHDEGSMGLLEVLPEYRNKGIATALQSYLMNYFMKNGWVPFSQVVTDNSKSLGLQKKLGMQISEASIYWLY